MVINGDNTCPNLKVCVCVCVCAVAEILESLAFVANATNMVLYMIQYMHMSPSTSANTVTNFIGTAFLLALLGGFLSDAFLTTYQTFLISSVLELLVCTLKLFFLSFSFPFFLHKNYHWFLRDFQNKITISFLFTCFLFAAFSLSENFLKENCFLHLLHLTPTKYWYFNYF